MNEVIKRGRFSSFNVEFFFKKWILKENPEVLSLKEFSSKNLLLRPPSKEGMNGEDNLKELSENYFLPLDVKIGLIILKKKDILEYWKSELSLNDDFYVFFDGTKIVNPFNNDVFTFFLRITKNKRTTWGIKKINSRRNKNEFSLVYKGK